MHFLVKNGKMGIMDPQWRSRKAERPSGSGHGRLNSYSPSRQTRVPPCAPVLCPLGASSRVRRRSHTRRHGVRPQKAHPPTLLLQPIPQLTAAVAAAAAGCTRGERGRAAARGAVSDHKQEQASRMVLLVVPQSVQGLYGRPACIKQRRL